MNAQSPPLPTCYRHDDRETRLACSSCDRPVCVDCVRTAAVGQKCPECAKPDRRAQVITARDLNSRTRGAPVTYTIVVIAVGVYLAGFVSRDLLEVLYRFGAQQNFLVGQGQWYRLFTSAFLHAPQLFHILFNMWALYLFGPELERRAGSGAFAALYLASAVSGGALFYFLGPPGAQAVGASGAIFGLFGAWLVASYRNRHTVVGQAQLRQLLVLLGINLALPLVVRGIAWEAHVGGLLAGVVILWAWGLGPMRTSALARTAAAAAVGLLALGAVILV